MPDRTAASTRLVPFLWFLASALALVAVLIRYLRGGEVAWALIGAAAFTLVMGVVALKRSGSPGV